MTRRLLAAACLVAAASVAGSAQGERGARPWAWERGLRPGARGANRAPIDVPLLAAGDPFQVVGRPGGSPGGQASRRASGGLKDLRLLDDLGREVPYLLVEPPDTEPAWTTSRALLPLQPTKTSSGFEVDLGSLAAVDRLRVEGLRPPFLKRLRLEGSGDRSRWTLLVADGSLFDLPDEHLRRVDLDFTPGSFRYLRLTWNDASSARLPMPASCRARLVASQPAAPPLRAALEFERRASEPGVSRYRLRLPGPRLPLVAVELEVNGGHVLRPARVTEGRLSDGLVVPVTLGEATLRRAVREDAAASDLRIPIEQPREPELELVVDDGDNPPLAIAAATGVFAGLPWIYFESADGATIRAVYGARDVAAPRYDLEAVRPSLGKLTPAPAAWEAPRAIARELPDAAEARLPTGGAPIDQSGFRVRRAIPPGPRGLTALTLDAAALAHSRISDVRIAGDDGRQVPYLLETPEAPLALPLPALEPLPREPPSLPAGGPGARSVYRLRLPAAGLPASRLVLSTTAPVFERRVQVAIGREDAGARGRAAVVAAATWRHADPDKPSRPLTLPLPVMAADTAWLLVDEGDNQALPLGEPVLLLRAYRLRFFRDSEAPLQLLYGRDDAAAPRYDLALLAPRLLGAAAVDVQPGPEEPGPLAAGARDSVKLFWAALVLAVAVLLVLVVRLVRQ